MYKYSFFLYSTTKSTISKMDIYKNYANIIKKSDLHLMFYRESQTL